VWQKGDIVPGLDPAATRAEATAMSEHRLIVRPRYGGPDYPDLWQVVDDSTVAGT
jgi:hypothetical protein